MMQVDLSCKCKYCNVTFFITGLDSILLDRNQFSISQISCPLCRRAGVDVTIVNKAQTTAEPMEKPRYGNDKFEHLKSKLNHAMEEYQNNGYTHEGRTRFAGFLISFIEELITVKRSDTF